MFCSKIRKRPMRYYVWLSMLVCVVAPQIVIAKANLHAPYFSQFSQDRYLHHLFFKNKRGGTFVELGAYDGVIGSNTLFFEKKLKWSGVCIEPLPEQFKRLKKTRSCICSNLAIADFNGFTTFIATGLLSGIRDKMDPRHVARISPPERNKKNIRVRCCTFKHLMAKYNVKQIDYLSLDVEGAEMDVLCKIDFSIVNIDVMSVESNYRDQSEAICSYLGQKGYIFIRRLGVDDIFCRKGFAGIYSEANVLDLEKKQGVDKLRLLPMPCYSGCVKNPKSTN